MSGLGPSSTQWLEPALKPRMAAVLILVGATVVVTSTLYYVAALPCPAWKGSTVCGWGWSPSLAIAVAVLNELAYVIALLVILRFLFVNRVGLAPEGLALRAGRRVTVVPWPNVGNVPRQRGRGLTSVRIRLSGYVWSGERHLLVPEGTAKSILEFREHQLGNK